MEIENSNIAIDKQQLAKMPTEAFGGEIVVVDTPEAVDEAVGYLTLQGLVGFDTETKPSFKKGQVNNVSLMQISTDTRCYLLRLNKTGLTDSIRRFLEDETVTKIGLSLKDDFMVLHRIGEFTPQGFIDLQTTVKAFHITDCSLQKIYGIVFGRRISKSQRLSNWEAGTLSPSQCLYAATDAWACLRIYHTLLSGDFHPHLQPESTTSSQQLPS